jgi:transglutaminase-like putative cysteine protease
MLYDIALRITYEYDASAAGSRNLLRLLPRELPGVQRLREARLEITPPPSERRTMLDFFGNPAVHVAFRAAHEEIAFAVAARVERLAEPPSLDISPPLDPAYRGDRRIPRARPRGAAPLPRPLAPRARLPRDDRLRARGDRRHLDRLRGRAARSTSALHRDMRFDAEATTVDTPPAEAFARRHGVCQDFAQVMIACLRGIGIPAGYVSGFLRTVPPPGQPRLEGADAMHAWTRVWCGFEAGWVELDPTNDLVVGTDHVVVARGRDYTDVAPVAGVTRTAGGHTTDQAVDVTALDDAA